MEKVRTMQTFSIFYAPILRIFALQKRYEMKRILSLILILTLCTAYAVGQKHTISGYIWDAQSHETLIGATILDLDGGRGAITNEYGFYSITLPDGTVNLRTGYVGYRTHTQSITLDRDISLNFELEALASLDEVTIVGNRLDLSVKGSQMSAIDIPIEQIKAVPAVFGEADVLKALQLLPGVQTGTEATAGIYVRGGNPDENLLLIDGVPVYNVNHMFGFFSVFNPDALKNVTLYKGSFPAHYCGRLSSVVDIRMKDGDMENYHGNVSIGMVSSKFNLEGPIVKDRTSFNISARRTYSDLMVNAAIKLNDSFKFSDMQDDMSMGYYFYDLNVKLNHKFSDTDRLYVSWYSGDDDIFFNYLESDTGSRIKDKLDWKWGNTVAAIRWNRICSPKLFMDISANHTRYRHRMGIGVTETDKTTGESSYAGLDMNSGIYDYTLRADMHWTPSSVHDTRFGAFYTHHRFNPDVVSVDMDGTFRESGDTVLDNHISFGENSIRAHECQFYLEDDISLTQVIKANTGLSMSLFNVGGKTFSSLEPRLSMRFLLSENFSLKTGYAYMTQYVHLLSNNTVSLPTDLWVPVTETIRPEHSHQIAAGAFYQLEDIADLSLEGYYKTEDNLLEYKEGVSFIGGSDDNWQEKIAMGRGWSYGMEFMAQRSIGRLNGWVSYTWSRTRRQFDRSGMVLNGGRPFDAKYDRRHEFDVTCNYRFSDRFDMSATWIYETGNCGTMYTQYYESDMPDKNVYQAEPELGYYAGRNNMRLNPTHRLDLGFNWHRNFSDRVRRTLNLSIYNAYNNRNPFLVYVYTESRYDASSGGYVDCRTLRQLTLFPILPTLSYTVSF